MFQGLKSVVQGADHIERSKICQDAAAFKAGEHYGVAACADGHGGAKYIRSEVGSRIAVECAIEVVDAYMEDYERFSREIRKNSSYILGHMAEKFMAAWTEKIEDYNDANPLSDAEREALAKARGDENNFYSFYGSTVLAAVAAEDFQYGFLVGDGGFAVVSQDGSVTIPIEDPNSHANYTSSLCSRDAISSFVSYYLEEKPLAMCVSTDGLIKSFDTEKDFLDYHVLLATMLQNPERCQVSLEKNLMKRTHSGSGDDISVEERNDFVAFEIPHALGISRVFFGFCGIDIEMIVIDFAGFGKLIFCFHALYGSRGGCGHGERAENNDPKVSDHIAEDAVHIQFVKQRTDVLSVFVHAQPSTITYCTALPNWLRLPSLFVSDSW